MLDRRAKNISAALKGRSWSSAQRAANTCPSDCACGKHTLRNSGQFQQGSAGFQGPHSEETKTVLASYIGERTSAYKHGWANTPTYVSWASMKGRCFDSRNASYGHYGERGITVCDRWLDFLNFLEDMGERPSLDHTLNRLNNDGDYEPGNVEWATKEEQSANRRDPGGWIARRARQQDY